MSDTAITILWYTVPLLTLFVMLVALWDAGVFDNLLAQFQVEEETSQPNDVSQLRWVVRTSVRHGRRS